MTKRRITSNIAIDFPDDSEEWNRIRTTPEMVEFLDKIGTETVSRCNDGLHGAQQARKQPVADGYDFGISTEGDRARLRIKPFTARAIAHEAVNHTILKSLTVGTPPDAAPDHAIPRELPAKGGLKAELDKRRAEAQAKADRKEAALQKRRHKAKVKSWLRAESEWRKTNPARLD